MKPLEVTGEVLGGDATVATKEIFEAFMTAVDGLDMQRAAHPLAGGLVEHRVSDTQLFGTRCEGGCAVRDQQGVLIEDRRQNRGDGVGADASQDGADRGTAAIGGQQDRHLLMRQTPLAGLATTLARLAIRRRCPRLPLFRPLPGSGSFAAFQHIGFVCLDDTAETGGVGLDRAREAMAPAKRRAGRDRATGRGLRTTSRALSDWAKSNQRSL